MESIGNKKAFQLPIGFFVLLLVGVLLICFQDSLGIFMWENFATREQLGSFDPNAITVAVYEYVNLGIIKLNDEAQCSTFTCFIGIACAAAGVIGACTNINKQLARKEP